MSEQKRKGSLHHWFKGSKSKGGKPGWVQADGSPCANEPGETKTPKCFSSARLSRLKSMGKKGESIIKSAVRRKRQEDPGQQKKSGGAKPTLVKTFPKGKESKGYVKPEPTLKEDMEVNEGKRDIPGKGSGKKDACYHKVKSRYDVWPSAYASGALVKCRKVGAKNWGNKTKKEEYIPEFASKKTIERIKSDEKGNSTFETGGMSKPNNGGLTGGWGRLRTDKNKKKMPEGYEYSNWRDEFFPTEVESVNIIEPQLLQPSKGIGSEILDESGKKCWKGYKKAGTQELFGKTYNNCVKANESAEMIRYCPACKKNETRSECVYGPKYWDMFSLPPRLSQNQMKFNIATVHPANEEKDHEQSMIRSELQTIKNAVYRLKKKMKGEGNVEAWVQCKITKAADYIDSAADYIDSGEMNVEEHRLDEIAPLPLTTEVIAQKESKTFSQFMDEAIDKSKMKCNKPKAQAVGDSKTGKSHVVKACEGGKEEIIRFGQRGVKGSPKKEGESEAYANRRKRFKSRHAKNIAKGKMSAAYWSNVTKW